MSQITVVDVSRWQGDINFDQLKNSVQGIVIKASGADGGLYVDSKLTRNRDEARRTGLPRWFYHYKGGSGTAKQQAQHFLSAIGNLQAGEGLVLDDENEGRINVAFDCEFADEIKRLTGGINIVIYSNQARFSGVDVKPLKDRNIGAWSAKYGTNSGNPEPPSATANGLSVIQWQYTSQGHVAGIGGYVDLNIFSGDQNAFKAYGAQNNVPAPSAPSVSAPVASGNGIYVVQSGDTLSGIGAKLGINWQTIANLNGITPPYVIYPNQRLKVYGGQAQAAQQPSASTYRVVSGDTLSGIQAKTGVNWKTIADLNGIKSPYIIYPNQLLKLGGAPTGGATYTVQRGDTLSGIGAKTNKPWVSIASLNGIKPPYVIYPNQVLRLP